MITKTTFPILSGTARNRVIGTRAEYRLFGLLIYRKTIYLPSYYGLESWDEYPYRI